jgi:hypothetical protein
MAGLIVVALGREILSEEFDAAECNMPGGDARVEDCDHHSAASERRRVGLHSLHTPSDGTPWLGGRTLDIQWLNELDRH